MNECKMIEWSAIKIDQMKDCAEPVSVERGYNEKHFRSRIGINLLPINVKSEEVKMPKVILRSLVWAIRSQVMPLIKNKIDLELNINLLDVRYPLDS